MNIIIVSHCPLNQNSGIHAYNIASELTKLGAQCAVIVPADSPFININNIPIFNYDDVDLIEFFRTGTCDIVLSFTSRQHVVNQTLKLVNLFRCSYIVHYEDNEELVLTSGLDNIDLRYLHHLPNMQKKDIIKPWRMYPDNADIFLKNAVGFTALVDDLLKFNKYSKPFHVFWPGFNEEFTKKPSDNELNDLLIKYKIPAADFYLFYSGLVHEVNYLEVQSLYLATAELKKRNYNVILIKCGGDQIGLTSILPSEILKNVCDLGFIDREDLYKLIHLATVLVQPGRSDQFNDYRFPSKIPEFLSTGIPVMVPDSNIGKFLDDFVNAVILKTADYKEIADKVEMLFKSPSDCQSIGKLGVDFANKKLSWGKNVAGLYSWIKSLDLTTNFEKACNYNIDINNKSDIKPIAFYLPQFHSIPENDKWWGKDFTEWVNVKRAKPNFDGHLQPKQPGDLGYYDLENDSDVMLKQTNLASKFGIYGFCFYHYWFDGKRLLEKPVNSYLKNRKISFPFCICWANENWTRRWDGMENEILIQQSYGDGWVEKFFNDALPYLSDSRYININGFPLLIIYRIESIPDSNNVVMRLKKLATENGLKGLHVAAVQFIGMNPEHPILFGADSAIEFPPHTSRSDRTFLAPYEFDGISNSFSGYIEDYSTTALKFCTRPESSTPWARGIMPSWDNTARRGAASHVYIDSRPEFYRAWLEYLVDFAKISNNAFPCVFVNAWNEWAEGAVLEPCEQYSYQYLNSTSLAVRGWSPIS